MELAAVMLVVGAAAVHAGWNALAKRSPEKLAFLWAFTAVSLILYAIPFAVALARHGMPAAGLPCLAASALTHVAYLSLLARAYGRADLSLAYPIARGTGLLLVPLLAVPIYGDHPTGAAWTGIALIIAGMLWLNRPALALLRKRAGSGGPLSGWGFLTGLTIAAYSLIDAGGVKRVHPVVYLYLLFAAIVAVLAPAVGRRWAAVRSELRRQPWAVIGAGAGAFGTYVVVLAALRLAPVAYVVPVREVSIVFGALIGTRLLHEPFGPSRVAASALVVIGVIAVAAGG